MKIQRCDILDAREKAKSERKDFLSRSVTDASEIFNGIEKLKTELESVWEERKCVPENARDREKKLETVNAEDSNLRPM